MRNTRVAGHGLNSEGKPFVISERTGGPVSPAYYTPSGSALCECGWMSEVLESNGQRKKAHAAHKDEMRLISDAERDDMTADFMVAIPVADPVPHYNRGRTFLAPDLGAMRVAGCGTCDGLGALPRVEGARWDDTIPCPGCSATPARSES
jgi:hypothetical protein